MGDLSAGTAGGKSSGGQGHQLCDLMQVIAALRLGCTPSPFCFNRTIVMTRSTYVPGAVLAILHSCP